MDFIHPLTGFRCITLALMHSFAFKRVGQMSYADLPLWYSQNGFATFCVLTLAITVLAYFVVWYCLELRHARLENRSRGHCSCSHCGRCRRGEDTAAAYCFADRPAILPFGDHYLVCMSPTTSRIVRHGAVSGLLTSPAR